MGFLVSKDLVTVKIEYIELGENNVFVISSEEYRNICNEKKIKIKTIAAKFSRPSWGKFNEYIKGTIRDDSQDGSSYMDTVLLRQQKFRYLLEEIYEIEDGENVSILLTEELLKRINADLAIALVAKYDETLNDERIEAAKILGLFDVEEEEEPKEEKPKEEKTKEDPEKNTDEEVK